MMQTRANRQDKVQLGAGSHFRSSRASTHAVNCNMAGAHDALVARVLGGDARDLSRIPVHAAAPLTLQAKLAISSPGDVYEQEADHVADRVVRMPEPTRDAACAYGGTCRSCEANASKQPERLSAKRVEFAHSGQVDTPATVQEVLSGSGQPLDASSRAFFEPRFGHDFSQVRVHTDAAAQQSAREVSANAYTVGHHIVFASGRFAPQSAHGRHLLAHELTHVVQQSRFASAPQVLQRDIGVELQLQQNMIKTDTGRSFGRKEGKFVHRVPDAKHGLELQIESGSFMEFETHHFQKFSELKAQIQSAVDIVTEIKKDPKKFAFNQEARLRKEGVLKKSETLVVEMPDSAFFADIQTTEGIALSQYESLLKEHERDRPLFVDPVLAEAQSVLSSALATSKSVKAGASVDNLRGFLQLILNYVRRGQRVTWDKTNQDVVKSTFRLMMRTNFALAFKDILTKDERALFKDIVKSDAIPKAVGIAATDPFFKTGYWGELNGQHAFFEHGKVTAVESGSTTHDCANSTKTAGVDSGACGKKISGTDITVGGWLNSILSGKQDLLSPAAHGSGSMGQLPVSKKPAEKNLVAIEVRGTVARNRTQPANKWVDYVDEVFSQAAVCRERTDSTKLDYNGTKPFDPTHCP